MYELNELIKQKQKKLIKKYNCYFLVYPKNILDINCEFLMFNKNNEYINNLTIEELKTL